MRVILIAIAIVLVAILAGFFYLLNVAESINEGEDEVRIEVEDTFEN